MALRFSQPGARLTLDGPATGRDEVLRGADLRPRGRERLGKAGLRPLLLLLGVTGGGEDRVERQIGLLDLVQSGQRVRRALR